jgi:hypothetical protein
MESASDVGDGLRENDATAAVRQLVDENKAAALELPVERALWHHDRWAKESGDGG